LSLWHNTRSQNWDRKTFKTPFPDHGPLPCKCLADWVRLALLAPRSSRPLLVRSGFSLGLRSQNWVRIAVPKLGLPFCKINRILINGLETRFQNMEPKTDPKLEPRPDRQAQISSAPAKDFWSAAAPPWRWPRDPRASTNWRGPWSGNGFLVVSVGPEFALRNVGPEAWAGSARLMESKRPAHVSGNVLGELVDWLSTPPVRLLAVLGKPVDWVSTSSEWLLVIFYKFFDSSIPCCRISLGCPLPAEVGEPTSRRLVDSLLSTRSVPPFTGGNL
jgi:hypothetical protein